MTGKELKALIAELGITQQAIADSCNVSRITLLKWLSWEKLESKIEDRIKAAVILEIKNQIGSLKNNKKEINTKIQALRKLQKKLRK
jgi:transcriptional regulator with XRE-family HTH domain